MKCTRILSSVVSAAVGLSLAGCESVTVHGLPPSFTLGFTGRTDQGQDYTLGLSIPIPTFKRKVEEPPLPVEPVAVGKNPVLPPP